jgi:hypothetical protein
MPMPHITTIAVHHEYFEFRLLSCILFQLLDNSGARLERNKQIFNGSVLVL